MADTKAKTGLPRKQAAEFKSLASKYNTYMSKADELRASLDELVLQARNAGGTFREIAALADRSVAWVQGSLERSKNRA